MSELQKEFEEWAKKQFHLLDKSAGGRYSHASTEWAWQAWRAAIGSMVVELPELCDGENSCKCYYESESIEQALDKAGIKYI